jgi:ribonuclease HI
MSSTSFFYAVAKGRAPGVYTTWREAEKQVTGFNYPKYRKFSTQEEADAFVKQYGQASKPDPKEEPSTEGYVVFTDGSAIGNGKTNAKAGYAMVWPNHPHLTTSKPLQGTPKTNNRAEFMACIDALEALQQEDPRGDQPLHVYTDSMLLINTVTKWIKGWKKNGWKKASGDEVQNLDLVKRLDELLTQRKATWTHVEAHTGNNDWMSMWNDKADKLAKSAAA